MLSFADNGEHAQLEAETGDKHIYALEQTPAKESKKESEYSDFLSLEGLLPSASISPAVSAALCFQKVLCHQFSNCVKHVRDSGCYGDD